MGRKEKEGAVLATKSSPLAAHNQCAMTPILFMPIRQSRMRHAFFLLAALLPAACAGTPWTEPVAAVGGAELASVMIFKRDMFDVVWSTITGKDCSIVRLDRGETYCRPTEPPPPLPPYCTRSLGDVDCWTSPAVLPNPPPGVADGPTQLTPEQEANRTHGWP